MKASRRAPVAGDIFVIELPTGKYLFGQVVLANPPRENAPMPGSYLIYIYSAQSETTQVDYEKLRRDNLLIAPVWTNQLGWTKGYFQVVGSRPLDSSVVLANHCFRRYDGVYLNEQGAKISKRLEPCGEWGLVSYRWIDDRVSDALGIPRVPLNERDRSGRLMSS
jgi:hypothetical protein